MLYVSYIAEYPRGGGPHGTCAFCHGDPCAETSGPYAEISKYQDRWMARYNMYNSTPGSLIAEGMREEGFTCPLCLGRPT